MIRDLEQLLSRVISDLSREYMREAIQCYHASAFRAAVVLGVAAAMDDLRRKVAELAAADGGAGISALDSEVEAQYDAHRAWHRFLLAGCKTHDVLSPAAHQRLHAVLQVGHLCAHPSGHRGSAEEARYIIATCIDLVLSRPPQLGGKQVEALMEKLDHPNFFAAAANESDDKANADDAVRTITQAELVRFRASALPGVAQRLAAIVREAPRDSLRHRHAGQFLRAMVTLQTPADARHLAWTAVAESVISAGDGAAFPVIAADPGGLRLLEPLARYRVLGAVRNHLARVPAQTALAGWITAGVLDTGEKQDLRARLKGEFLAFDGGHRDQAGHHTNHVAVHGETLRRASDAVACVQWDEFAADYVKWLIDAAHDGDLHIENAVIDHVMGMKDREAALFSPRDRARLVANILQAAEHGAEVAENACRQGLGGQGAFARAFYDESVAGRCEFPAQAWEWAEILLAQLAGDDLPLKLATAIVEGKVACARRKFLLWNLSSSEHTAIADIGDAAHSDEDDEDNQDDEGREGGLFS